MPTKHTYLDEPYQRGELTLTERATEHRNRIYVSGVVLEAKLGGYNDREAENLRQRLYVKYGMAKPYV